MSIHKIKAIAFRTALSAIGIFAIIMAPSSAHAGDYEGGTIANNCKGRGLTNYLEAPYVCTDNGYGWVYYQFEQPYKDNPQDIYFGPATTGNGGKLKLEGEDCKSYDGFYHFGIYTYKSFGLLGDMSVGPMSDYGTSVQWTKTTVDGIAALGNPMHGGLNHGGLINGANLEDKLYDGANFTKLANEGRGAHKFYNSSNQVIAQSWDAVKNGDAWAAYQRMNEKRISMGLAPMDKWKGPLEWKESTIVAFCGDVITAKNATFDGTISVTVNGDAKSDGQTVNIDKNATSATVSFKHEIRRTDEDGPDGKVHSNWSTEVNHTNASTGSGTVALKKKADAKVVKDGPSYTVPVEQGATVEVCETLNYDREVKKENGAEAVILPRGVEKVCVKIHRPKDPAKGSFEAKTTCTSTAGTNSDGTPKVSSSSCDTNLDTNSKNWYIKHTGTVISHSSGTIVPASKADASDAASPYTHGELAYGVGGKCYRSKNPFTYWEFRADGLDDYLKDITLYYTQDPDLPIGFLGDNNLYKTEMVPTKVGSHQEFDHYDYTPIYECQAVSSGSTGPYSDSSCSTLSYEYEYTYVGTFRYVSGFKWTGSYTQVIVDYDEKPVYVDVDDYEDRPVDYYHYNNCESTTTNFYDFSAPSPSQSWSNTSDLLFANDKDKTVSVKKCSQMKAVKDYSNEVWSGESISDACNTITRWRRYAPFKSAITVKADAGQKTVATTVVATATSSSGTIPEIDTTNNDGYFTLTFDYAINRGATENAKDGSGSENFYAKNKWSTMESIAPADGGVVTYPINGDYGVWSNQEYFESTESGKAKVATKSKTINGQLYFGQRILVCANAAYGKEVKEIDSDPYSKINKKVYQDDPDILGCVYIKRGDGDENNNCGNVVAPGSVGYEYGHQTGYNIAKIRVMNDTTKVTSPYTSWAPDEGLLGGNLEYSQGVWARPGDMVRYQINYCMGANYAHAIHRAHGISDTTTDPILYVKGDLTGLINEDTNKLTEGQRSNYLFGDTVGTYNSTTKSTSSVVYSFTKRNADGTIDLLASISPDNISGALFSPDITGSDKKIYSCKNGGNGNEKDNYYQIAGKASRNGVYTSTDNYSTDCTGNRTQSIDVGRQLSEQLIWTNTHIINSISAETNGEFSRKAYVYVPYNYIAKPFITNDSKPTGTVQIGGKMNFTPGIAVLPRKNCAFAKGYDSLNYTLASDDCRTNSDANFATITKPTTVTFETVIDNRVVPGSTKTIVVRANTKSYKNGSKDVATSTESGGGPILDTSAPHSIDVPNDIDPGAKVCIKMTITPADSHNDPSKTYVWGASISNEYQYEVLSTNDTNHVWWGLRDSTAGTTHTPSSATVMTCSTAVKRPTMSVEDSNLYTATSVATSVVARTNGDTQYLYGSWTEYGIFGKVVTSAIGDIGTLGMGSGASYGYNQTSFFSAHSGLVRGFNPQPLTVVVYNGGPKNGTHNYNYSLVTTYNVKQRKLTYNYERKDDGSHYYKLISNEQISLVPSSYSFANMPIVNAGNSVGSAKKNNSTICIHATQTFANSSCDSGQIGTSGVGSDAAESFTANLLSHYDTSKLKASTVPADATKYGSYVNITDGTVPAGQIEGDENAAMYKYVPYAFLGYENENTDTPINLATLTIKTAGDAEGEVLKQSVGSSIIYKATNLVINSSIIANNDEKNNAGDFRMPIIIADRVWLTGNPTQIDAIIITNELNTCKWDKFSDFKNSTTAGTVNMNTLSSDVCNTTVRFTAPVVVKGKVILNRTAGAGGGDDQIRRAEIFELSPATYLWSFAEASRYSQAITTYSRELPSRY